MATKIYISDIFSNPFNHKLPGDIYEYPFLSINREKVIGGLNKSTVP